MMRACFNCEHRGDSDGTSYLCDHVALWDYEMKHIPDPSATRESEELGERIAEHRDSYAVWLVHGAVTDPPCPGWEIPVLTVTRRAYKALKSLMSQYGLADPGFTFCRSPYRSSQQARASVVGFDVHNEHGWNLMSEWYRQTPAEFISASYTGITEIEDALLIGDALPQHARVDVNVPHPAAGQVRAVEGLLRVSCPAEGCDRSGLPGLVLGAVDGEERLVSVACPVHGWCWCTVEGS